MDRYSKRPRHNSQSRNNHTGGRQQQQQLCFGDWIKTPATAPTGPKALRERGNGKVQAGRQAAPLAEEKTCEHRIRDEKQEDLLLLPYLTTEEKSGYETAGGEIPANLREWFSSLDIQQEGVRSEIQV